MAKKKKIVAFCCENSAYKVAESIRKSSEMRSIELVKVPCAGKIEVVQMLKCLEEGAGKVLVLGCPIDNCKYVKGNRRALKRVNVAKQALKDAGIEEDKVLIELISSLDTHKLAETLKELRKT